MVCPFLVLHSHKFCVFPAVVELPRHETEIARGVVCLVAILVVALKFLPTINGIEGCAHNTMYIRSNPTLVSIDGNRYIARLLVQRLFQFSSIKVYPSI
jgi:hypothetical protein